MTRLSNSLELGVRCGIQLGPCRLSPFAKNLATAHKQGTYGGLPSRVGLPCQFDAALHVHYIRLS